MFARGCPFMLRALAHDDAREVTPCHGRRETASLVATIAAPALVEVRDVVSALIVVRR